MIGRNNSRDLLTKPQIVAAIHSAESLRAALRLRAGVVDLFEFRVDHFADDPTPLLRAVPRLAAPLIITARHPAEGGQNALTTTRRRELYGQFLPCAALIDVELRSAKALSTTIAEARAAGVGVILSAHDFRTTPSAARLPEIVRRAAAAGADVCKIATRADTPAALERLLALFSRPAPMPLAVMAMGRFGKVSRILFAQAGSVLNYGYLAEANAPGQWPAARLRELLAELTS
jgi:3-dehydroquinate dehydratase-1